MAWHCGTWLHTQKVPLKANTNICTVRLIKSLWKRCHYNRTWLYTNLDHFNQSIEWNLRVHLVGSAKIELTLATALDHKRERFLTNLHRLCILKLPVPINTQMVQPVHWTDKIIGHNVHLQFNCTFIKAFDFQASRQKFLNHSQEIQMDDQLLVGPITLWACKKQFYSRILIKLVTQHNAIQILKEGIDQAPGFKFRAPALEPCCVVGRKNLPWFWNPKIPIPTSKLLNSKMYREGNLQQCEIHNLNAHTFFRKLTKFNDTFTVYSHNAVIFYVKISAKNIRSKISYGSQRDPPQFQSFWIPTDCLPVFTMTWSKSLLLGSRRSRVHRITLRKIKSSKR